MYIVLAVPMSRLCRSSSADRDRSFHSHLVKDRSQARGGIGGLPLVSTSELGQWGLYGGVRGLICLAEGTEQGRAYGLGCKLNVRARRYADSSLLQNRSTDTITTTSWIFPLAIYLGTVLTGTLSTQTSVTFKLK